MFSPNCSISSDDDAEGINVNEITVMLNSTFTNDELCYDPQIYVTTPKQLYSSRRSNECMQFSRIDTTSSLYTNMNSDLNTFINPLGNMQFLPSVNPTTSTLPIQSNVLPEPDILDFSDDDTYFSRDRILQLLTSIPSLSQRISNLENKNAALESKCEDLEAHNKDINSNYKLLQSAHELLKTSFEKHCITSNNRFNSGEQYTRRNSFLLNKLRWIPKYRGWKFSAFIARLLTKLFPDFPVALRDIDTSHTLYKDEENKPVIVVKFINRDLRNLIWDERSCSTDKSIFLTEHFTPFNKGLLKKAQQAGYAWSDKCRIFARVNGQKKLIESEADLAGIDPGVHEENYHAKINNPVRRAPPRFNPDLNDRIKRRKQFNRRNFNRNHIPQYRNTSNTSLVQKNSSPESFFANNHRPHSSNFTFHNVTQSAQAHHQPNVNHPNHSQGPQYYDSRNSGVNYSNHYGNNANSNEAFHGNVQSSNIRHNAPYGYVDNNYPSFPSNNIHYSYPNENGVNNWNCDQPAISSFADVCKNNHSSAQGWS